MNTIIRIPVVTLAAVGFVAGASRAQEATTPVAPDLAAPAVAEEELVVLSPFSVNASQDQGYTATSSLAGGRLSTSLNDTSSSITVLTREFLDDVAATDYVAMAEWAPNAVSQYAYQSTNPWADYEVNFRSMGTGFPARNYFRSYLGADSFSTSRVDFARGPNSIVFGDAGVGGLANISSKRASPKDSAELALTWNSFGGYRSTIEVNRVVSDKLSVLAAGMIDNADGWRDNNYSEKKGIFLTATYRFTPKTSVHGELELGEVVRLISADPTDQYTNWNGTLVQAPLTSGEFPITGVSRRTSDRFVWMPNNPAAPGIVNVRNWGYSNGTNVQFLENPHSKAPAGAPTIARNSIAFQAPDSLAENPYGTGALFLEHQIGDNIFLEAAGSYLEQYRKVDQFRPDGIVKDVNAFLPNGNPNPNAGKAYIESDNRDQNLFNHVYEARFSAAYLLNTKLTRQRLLVSAGQRWDRFDKHQHEVIRVTSNRDATSSANDLYYRLYLENLKPGLQMPSDPSNPARRVSLERRYDENELQYVQLAASGSWFAKDQLRTILAWRNDVLNIARAANVVDPVTKEWVAYGPELASPEVKVSTITAGSVVGLTNSLNLFANYSESFQPTTSSRGIDGENLPPLLSNGIDIGVRFRLMDGRISGSVAYYLNEQDNSRASGASADINPIWQDLGRTEMYVTDGYSDTFSLEGEGYEFEMTANLTSTWRLMANISVPDAIQKGGYDATEAYYNTHIETWRAGAAAQTDPVIRDRINQNILDVETRIQGFAEGRKLNNSHKYTANFFTNYTVGSGLLKDASVGFGVQMRGQRLIQNSPAGPFDYIWDDEYFTLSASVGYKMKIFDNWMRVQVNVYNLLDEDLVIAKNYNNYTVGGVRTYFPGRYNLQNARQFKISATYRF